MSSAAFFIQHARRYMNFLPAGKAWQSKIADIEAGMEKRGVDVLVITGLDETACMYHYYR